MERCISCPGAFNRSASVLATKMFFSNTIPSLAHMGWSPRALHCLAGSTPRSLDKSAPQFLFL